MKRLIGIALALALFAPGIAQAQGRSAETVDRLDSRATDLLRAAAVNTELAPAQTSVVGSRRSPTKILVGLGIAAAGVAMLMIEPEQPTQPRVVTTDALVDRAVENFPLDYIGARLAIGLPVLICEPNCLGDVDIAIAGSYIAGGAVGIASVADILDSSSWTVYEGTFVPFKKRSNGLKLGGAALAIAGAAVAALWSSVPVVNTMAISPTDGGLAVGGRFVF